MSKISRRQKHFRFEPDIFATKESINADDGFLVSANSEDMSFTVKRSSTGTIVFDTSIGGLVFADQYIQIATRLPSENLYGLGENVHQTLKHKFDKYKTWSMFARDQATESVGEHTGNLYGVHPFYLVVENDGKAHG
uniref:NtCtMGAM_N domain-containing protein n=1 Tax=Syphacia muris TaxID=451379 RepID=A0A0N5ACL1_9BILA